MGKAILKKILLFIGAGAGYALFSHYLMKGFNQPFEQNELVRDFFTFGTIMVVITIVQEQIQSRKKKKKDED